jgi:hypothetical protein
MTPGIVRWHLLYCDEDLQGCPVTEFIDACRPRHQVKVLRFLGLLEEMGPTLPRPYADLLRDGVHELRIKVAGEQVRLLYFFCYRRFIILYHAFVKKTDRVPEKFIDTVIAYRQAFLDRTSARQLEAFVDAVA